MRIESRKGEREEQDESRQGCGQFESSALLAAIDGKRYSGVLGSKFTRSTERERKRERKRERERRRRGDREASSL